MNEHLYFIAVVLPPDIQDEITQLKHLVADRFGSKHSLNSPPHITLHMPFRWKDKKLNLLQETIREIDTSLQPFEVELNGFGFFEARVVFVGVVENKHLEELQGLVVDQCSSRLRLDNANYKNRPFHPHITIGFRDLRKRMFYEAREYFEGQKISFKFQVSNVTLLKHDGKRWEIHRRVN